MRLGGWGSLVPKAPFVGKNKPGKNKSRGRGAGFSRRTIIQDETGNPKHTARPEGPGLLKPN